MYYVYLWLREDRTPYYVGKGKKYRAYQKHIIGCPPPKDRVIIVKEFEDEDESYLFEEWLIQVYGRKCEGGILLNTSIGGRKRNSRVRTESEFKERQKKTVKKYQQSGKGKETYKKWVAENNERVKEIKKKYYDKNKEILNEKARNSERKKMADKIYREKNIEKVRKYDKEYYQKNKERLREYHRQYYQRKKLESEAYPHTI